MVDSKTGESLELLQNLAIGMIAATLKAQNKSHRDDSSNTKQQAPAQTNAVGMISQIAPIGTAFQI